RRHTSFSRDWSSDVCSSDLRRAEFYRRERRKRRIGLFSFSLFVCFVLFCENFRNPPRRHAPHAVCGEVWRAAAVGARAGGGGARSEERRVGKECGARWPEWH